jgi:hypothetical protein
MMRAVTLFASFLLVCSLAAGVRADEKKKFPAPVVNEILTGWNGVAWGDTLDSFKKKFPDAKPNDAGRWLIGKDETLAGVKVTVQYTFNKKNQFEMVTFVPDDEGQKNLRQKLQDEGVLREGSKGSWSSQGVTFAIGNLGEGKQIAIAINARFKDAAAPPKK